MRSERRNHSRPRTYAIECTPASQPCDRARNVSCGISYSSIGPVITGFDAYGYPVVRNMFLPKPYEIDGGRKYGAQVGIIRPMKLVVADGETAPIKIGLATVANGFRIKASPSVPAAPGDLPPQFKFCVHKGASGYFLRFRNAKTSTHGAAVEVTDCQPDESGLMICKVQREGFRGYGPICEGVEADKEPLPVDCCVELKGDASGQLVCAGSGYDLLIVQVLPGSEHYINGIKRISVTHPDLPGGGARLPVCEPIDEVPEDRPCCIEEGTGLIVCPPEVPFGLAGSKIPLEYLEFVDEPDGTRVARLICGDIINMPPEVRHENQMNAAMFNICNELGGYKFQICKKVAVPSKITDRPRPRFPDLCCFDPRTSSLICEGTPFHGLIVEVVAQSASVVSVRHQDIPGETIRIPTCKPEIVVIPTVSKKPLSEIEIPPPPERPPPPPEKPRASPEPPMPPMAPIAPSEYSPTSCEPVETSVCYRAWQEMIRKPVKMTKCDERWLNMLEDVRRYGCGRPTSGRRFSAMGFSRVKVRKYSRIGIAPEHREHGRFPGLRGERGRS